MPKLFPISENNLAKYGDCWHAKGRYAGIKFAAHVLREQSGKYFAEDDDKRAQEVRTLAAIIDGLAEKDKIDRDGAHAAQKEIWDKVFANDPIDTNHPSQQEG